MASIKEENVNSNIPVSDASAEVCKSCHTALDDQHSYCHQCGCRVIKNRLTLSALWNQLVIEVLGIDNTFFRTIKGLTIAPKEVCLGYISGTRKKYLSPFAYLTIICTLSTLLYIQFSDALIETLRTQINEQYALMSKFDASNARYQQDIEKQRVGAYSMIESIVKYYSIYIFLTLPLFSIISKLTFGKRFNFIEHLVIDAYAIGYWMFINIFFYMFTRVTGINAYVISSLVSVAIFIYFYQQILQLSHFQSLKYTLKFAGITMGLLLLSSILLGILIFIQKQFFN